MTYRHKIWAMHPDHINDYLTLCKNNEAPRPEGVALAGDVESGPVYALDEDGIATIEMVGPVVKSAPWWFEYLGLEATDVTKIRGQLAAAANDPAVKGIKLLIDSPGGTVGGVQALGEDIRALRDKKPVQAHVDGMAASAAYWLAAQASEITADATSMVGSIGVYLVIDDASEMFADAGIKRHVVSSHELKGSGVYGATLTEAQLADFQREIDQLAGIFVDQVAIGRGMDPRAVKKLATGQVWIGDEALAFGLVDRLGSEQPTTAPHGVTEAKAMEEKIAQLEATNGRQQAENEDLIKRIDALDKQVEAQTAQLVLAQEAQREAILSKYRDRVAPSSLDSVREYGAQCCANDPAKFEAFVSSMVVVANAEPQGVDSDPEDIKPPAELSDSQRGVLSTLSHLGLTAEMLAKVN